MRKEEEEEEQKEKEKEKEETKMGSERAHSRQATEEGTYKNQN